MKKLACVAVFITRVANAKRIDPGKLRAKLWIATFRALKAFAISQSAGIFLWTAGIRDRSIRRRIYGLVACLRMINERAIDNTRLIAMRTNAESISGSTNSQTDFRASRLIDDRIAAVRALSCLWKKAKRAHLRAVLSLSGKRETRPMTPSRSAVSMTRVSSPNFRAGIREGTQTRIPLHLTVRPFVPAWFYRPAHHIALRRTHVPVYVRVYV